MKSQIMVTNEQVFEDTISPLIYGEFIEFIDNLIPGTWAERLRDRSFAGMTQPSVFYRKEKDFPQPAWRVLRTMDGREGAGQRIDFDVTFDLDPSHPFAGTYSAHIQARLQKGTLADQKGFLAGIIQDNVPFSAGETFHLELFMRGVAPGVKVHVFIGREYGAYVDQYDEVVFDGIDKAWKRFEGELHSTVTDPSGCFAIALDGPGTLWVDKVSLMPTDNRDGWRRDVVEAVRATHPGCIRFGGSSLIYYDWRQGIGPRERRAPFLNTPWNNMEENDVGLDEFLHFCELVEAEPLICVNSNANTPEEIACEVEYVNGPVDSEYGRQRAQNGHPQPYRVKYWQIGNEQSGDAYEAVLAEFARAMKAVDPSIQVMASYPSDNIIENLSSELDYVCPHFYNPDIAVVHQETDRLRTAVTASCPRLKLGITEWNHTGGDWGEARAWLQTLSNGIFIARMFNHFQRNGDYIRIANRSNLVNSFFSGSIQTKPTDLYFTPAYYVQKLYATLSGPVAVRVVSDVPGLDISGTMDEDGSRFMIWVVNAQSTAIQSRVMLGETELPSSIRLLTITGEGPSAVNSFEQKHNVAPVEKSIRPSRTFRREFPAWSVTGIELQMEQVKR